MLKSLLNKYCRKFGFEVHGVNYMQSLRKSSSAIDAFGIQKGLVKGNSPVIFDLGANVGNITAKYIELFPGAVVYAFEPFADLFNDLAERYKNNPSVHCFNMAISDKDELKTFYVNRNADTNSILKPKATGLSSDRQVENLSVINVPSLTLDEFCRKNNIDHIDMLKMDIQGGELAALKGATRLLQNRAILNIYTEAYLIEQYESQPLLHDISQFLHGYEFSLQDIYSPIYGKGHLAWADVIFTLKTKAE